MTEQQKKMNRRKYLKYVGGAAVAVAAVGAGAYFYNQSIQPSPTKTVKGLYSAGARFSWPVKALKTDFEASNPKIKVDIEEAALDDVLFKKTPTELSTGSKTYNALNVLSEMVPAFATQKYIYDVSDWVNSDDPNIGIPDFQEDFGPTTYKLAAPFGKIVYMPHDINAHILYYRQPILEQYGFTASTMPTTLDAVKECITTINNPPDWYGAFFQLMPWYACGKWSILYWSMGGPEPWGYLNATTWEPTANTTYGRDALEWLLWVMPYLVPGCLNFFDPDAIEHLGSVGDAVYLPFEYANGSPSDPEISPLGNDIRHGRVPTGPSKRASMLGGVASCVNAAAENKLETYLFLRYLCSGGAVGVKYCANTGQHGRTSVLANPAATTPASRHLAALGAAVKTDAHFKPPIVNLQEVETIIGDELHPVLEGKADAAAALESLDTKLHDAMENAGYYA